MQKPLSGEYQPSYQKYFDLLTEGTYSDLLSQNSLELIGAVENIPGNKLDFSYAEGKWTIKELLMHIIDTERVFSYRGLVAARGDATPHHRMDEELYASNADVSHRTSQSLISEFTVVRSSTQTLFENITGAQSRLPCNIVTHPMTARAIGYFIIGHARHHLNIISERYLPTV
jgi:hypothetical protein